MLDRMYVVVRDALSSGLKAAQACHALTAFTFAHPQRTREWFESSNHLVVLQCDDVGTVADDLEGRGFPVVRFHEPDMGGALTAICTDGSARRALRDLPLAG